MVGLEASSQVDNGYRLGTMWGLWQTAALYRVLRGLRKPAANCKQTNNKYLFLLTTLSMCCIIFLRNARLQ